MQSRKADTGPCPLPANDFIREESGPLWSVQTQATYVMSPSSLFQLRLGLNRQEAQIAPCSYSAAWFGSGFDITSGWLAGVAVGGQAVETSDKVLKWVGFAISHVLIIPGIDFILAESTAS